MGINLRDILPEGYLAVYYRETGKYVNMPEKWTVVKAQSAENAAEIIMDWLHGCEILRVSKEMPNWLYV